MRRFLIELDRRKRFWQFATLVGAVALLVRITVLMMFFSGWLWQTGRIHDDWNKLAMNLVDHGIFGFNDSDSTLVRGPLFPVLEIPLYLAFGQHYLYWSLALIVFDVGTCLILMVLARKVWGCRTALLAGAFYALHLAVAYYVCQIEQFESMLPLVAIWFCLICLWEQDYSRPWVPWVLGVVSGLMILNKTVYLPVVFVTGVSLWWFKPREMDGKAMGKLVVIYLSVSVLVVAPWTLRNYKVSKGKIIPVQAYFWALMWQNIDMFELNQRVGMNRADGGFKEDFMAHQQLLFDRPENRFLNDLKGPQKELAYEKIFANASTSWMKDNPGKTLRIKLGNSWQFWIGAENLKKTLLLAAMQSVFLGTALAGLWLLWRYHEIQKVKYGLILLMILWAEHTAVFAWGRFSLDLVPVLGVFWGLGVDAWARRIDAKPVNIEGV